MLSSSKDAEGPAGRAGDVAHVDVDVPVKMLIVGIARWLQSNLHASELARSYTRKQLECISWHAGQLWSCLSSCGRVQRTTTQP